MSLEIDDLKKWLGSVPRHPRQTHGLNESDCEVIALGGGQYLASTVDSIAEEITFGLYEDPFTMGWMCATASLSDLAAVGAKPTGLLFSAHWDAMFTLAQKKRAVHGLKAALKKAATPLLGGDTGQATNTMLTGVGLGFCDSKPMSRMGLRAGDLICMTGKMGLGPALGFRLLLGDPQHTLLETDFRPLARIKAGQKLRPLATAAMDSSDGLASTLNTLCQLNGVGLELSWKESWLDEIAKEYCMAMKLPLTSLLFGEHGDFQLVFGLRPKDLVRAKAAVKDLVVIGRALSARQGTRLVDARGKSRRFELDFVASAPKTTMPEISQLFRKMLRYAATL